LTLTILLSIKPKYAEDILSGLKEYELRKGVLFKTGARVVLYASRPIKAIIGEFTAGRIYTGRAEEVVELVRTTRPRGVTEEDILYIVGRKCRVSAVEVTNPLRYRRVIPLSELRKAGLRNPPRSYIVLRPENPVHAEILRLVNAARL
jgi:predicted transcriptional regulator